MKLLRWAVGGASAYAIYKYSIGRKAKGEDVFVSPEKEIEKLTQAEEPPVATPAPPKPRRTRRTSTKKT